MVTRIGPTKPLRHYLRDWREKKGLTQQQLADRLSTSKDQISRWERHERGMTMEVQAALAEALPLDSPADLFRDPEMPSADALLRRATPEQRKQALYLIEAILKAG